MKLLRQLLLRQMLLLPQFLDSGPDFFRVEIHNSLHSDVAALQLRTEGIFVADIHCRRSPKKQKARQTAQFSVEIAIPSAGLVRPIDRFSPIKQTLDS